MLRKTFLVWMAFFCTVIPLNAGNKEERESLYAASYMSAGVAVSAGAIYLILKKGYNIAIEKTWWNIPLNVGTLGGTLFTVLLSGRLLWQEVPEYYNESRMPVGKEWVVLSSFGASIYALYRASRNNAIRNS